MKCSSEKCDKKGIYTHTLVSIDGKDDYSRRWLFISFIKLEVHVFPNMFCLNIYWH